MELIARRCGGVLALYLFAAALGVVLCILGIGSTAIDDAFLTCFIPGILVILVSVVICIRYFTVPKEIIQYDGEKLIFPQGRYAPSEIKNVTYYLGRKRYLGNGSLKVYMTDAQVFSFAFVANVEEVHNRLIELRLQAGNSEI